MVIHEHKLVFIHVPKAAGVSITHMLMSHVIGHDTSGEIGHLSVGLKCRFGLRGKQKHKPGRLYVRDDDISQKNWDEYYKFAVVRNPWDRAVSEFTWRQTLPTRRPSKDFATFLRYCETRIRGTSRDIYWAHAQPQSAFVTDESGDAILDDIFRFEDLGGVVDALKDRTGLSLELPKYNDTPHKNYRQYYDKGTMDFVRKLYVKDIDMFGYEF